MSLSSALSVALTGLQISTAQLQITSNNISNAQTAGYTDKTTNITSLSLGNDAAGAQITGFSRATNSGLTTSYNNATSESSYYSTQNSYLSQIQQILDSTDNPPALSNAVSQFQSAWTQYAAAPEDGAQQQAVIQAGENLASQIATAQAAVTKLNNQVTSDTLNTVNQLNNDLSQIANLNQQIAAAGPGTQSGVNLADQRDTLVNSVASITNITIMQRSNGQVALYTPSGSPLVDGSAQVFSYNGQTITSSSGQDVTNILTGGSLQAEVQFVANGSPATASTSPGVEVIRKLNSQLQALTTALTTTSGSPTSFEAAYDGATTGTGELANQFFTVNTVGGVIDPSSLKINASLLNGTATLKQASGTAVNTALTATRSFSAAGLTTTSGTYVDLVNGILSGFQAAANTVSTQSTTATQQQTYYKQSLTNATGVNVDNELVNLTTLQNSYAASAHVISTINQMLQELEAAVTGTA
ncbi:MAG TPA: flagellar hook-associated protein FlgK [Alphaproteobacteria bacterium]|nr:flagellar hook-associated protein FlgK [Alphaproteobacteria bacterium]